MSVPGERGDVQAAWTPVIEAMVRDQRMAPVWRLKAYNLPAQSRT